ncbi:MAG: hypothetical protein ACAH95_09470, partial [Fimbriimonas sp.]
MSICSALVALSLAIVQGGDSQGGPLKVDGKEIPLRLVSTPAPAPPEGFLTWDGWQYLTPPATKVWQPYAVASNWSEIAAKHEAAKAVAGHVWRSKVFVMMRTEAVERDASGVLRVNRDTLSEKQLQETLEAIARVRAWLTAEFGGKFRFEPDIEIESDTLRWTSYGPDFAQWYVGPRVNGGTYVNEEDKTYRGPFSSVLYVLPGCAEKDPAPSVINGTPVSGVYANSDEMPVESGRLELALRDAVLKQIEERLQWQGYQGPAGSTEDPWAAATSLEEPSTDVLLQRFREGKGISLP